MKYWPGFSLPCGVEWTSSNDKSKMCQLNCPEVFDNFNFVYQLSDTKHINKM